MFTGKTPDITPAQILGVIAAIVGLLVSNQTINSSTAKLITDLAAILVPVAVIFADAHIRNGRAKALLAPTPVAPPSPVAPTVKP